MKKTITLEFPDGFQFPKKCLTSYVCLGCPVYHNGVCILTQCTEYMLEKYLKPCPFYDGGKQDEVK